MKKHLETAKTFNLKEPISYSDASTVSKILSKNSNGNTTLFAFDKEQVAGDIYLNKRAPIINSFYGIIYGSGLIYSLANTTANQDFDFPHLCIGYGLRFYNALDFNVIYGMPIVKHRS